MNPCFSRKAIPPALLSVLLLPCHTLATPQYLSGPDASADVGPASGHHSWLIENGATLNVLPGGQVQEVRSFDANLFMEGSSMGQDQEIYLSNSTAIIRNSTLDGGTRTALNVTDGSVAQVYDSRISSIGRGVNVPMKGSVSLANTQVYGADNGGNGNMDGGVGIALVNGKAEVVQKSHVVGDRYGAAISSNRHEDPASWRNSLVVDNAHIEGKGASAIKVESFFDNRPSQASIIVSNGGTLTGGNGVILEVAKNANVDFAVSNSHLTGDIVVADTARTAVSLINGASLNGTMAGVQTLSIENASWTLAANANVQDLTLSNGRVDLGGANGNFHQLDLDTLNGSGTFGLGTDLAAGIGDKVVVSGNASGNHQLAIQNTGTDVGKGQSPLEVVKTGSGDAQFAVLGGQVDLGTFVYDLQRQGNDWFLVQRPGEVVTPGTRSVLGLFSAAPTVWYGESSSLRSRMGELRMGTGESGVWSRTYGNRYNLSAGGGVGYQQRQQGLSVGADGALPVSDGKMLVGVMGGYSRSDLDLAGGTTGSVDSYYVGLYGTWLADDGYYVDALMKLNRFQNKSDVRMSDGQRSRGDYNNQGLGVSVEAGKRVDLDNGVFVTPFAQFSMLQVQGEQYELDNGMQARSNKADSLLGKIGTYVGQTRQMAQHGQFDYYGKIAIAQEFANNNEVRVNSNRFTNDLSGTRAELGVGTAVQVSERLQLHADFDYVKGQNLEQPWGISLGARYNF